MALYEFRQRVDECIEKLHTDHSGPEPCNDYARGSTTEFIAILAECYFCRDQLDPKRNKQILDFIDGKDIEAAYSRDVAVRLQEERRSLIVSSIETILAVK